MLWILKHFHKFLSSMHMIICSNKTFPLFSLQFDVIGLHNNGITRYPRQSFKLTEPQDSSKALTNHFFINKLVANHQSIWPLSPYWFLNGEVVALTWNWPWTNTLKMVMWNFVFTDSTPLSEDQFWRNLAWQHIPG